MRPDDPYPTPCRNRHSYASFQSRQLHFVGASAGSRPCRCARAIRGLQPQPRHVRIDGNRAPRLEGLRVETVIGGDDQDPAIAAASILAKTVRDHLMLQYAEQFPAYGFERHMGYGTAVHMAALREHGPCEIHRRSFAPVARVLAGH